MKYLHFVLLIVGVGALTNGMHHATDEQHAHEQHSHEGHLHETLVDGKKLEVDVERFDKFMQDLSGVKIAVVDVKGMVCDFCARGIAKTFHKDKTVQKVDVDLNRGKVLIAYRSDKNIDFDDIKKKITANGQSATGLKILDAASGH